eukprot:COSAG01_NODE_68281_length_264_cov_1.200000_1_plen_56_part_10
MSTKLGPALAFALRYQGKDTSARLRRATSPRVLPTVRPVGGSYQPGEYRSCSAVWG